MEVVTRDAVLGGDAVRAWAHAAVAACTSAQERIDAVNVFPVPDADTGSNVLLTVTGGAEAVAARTPGEPLAAVVAAFADGAARSARGNSGIILGQWLVGLADGAGGAAGLDAHGLAHALRRAAEAARAAVPDPQEGTVLTVAREVADVVARLAAQGADLVGALAGATETARRDLDRLSDAHDVLRAARVVDAGACALIVVLDALVAVLRGTDGADLSWLPTADPTVVATCAPVGGGAFEVMMLVRPGGPDAPGLAAALQVVGDSVAVADAGGVLHAHVHTDDPATAVAVVPAEVREQVVVRRVDGPSPGARGLVVLTASPGLAAWYATCGAVVLVDGSAPDAGQVARAAVDSRAEHVVVVDAGLGAVPPDAPHEAVAVAGDGPAVVACLALVAGGLATSAASAALDRLRSAATTAERVLDDVATLLPEVPDAQSVTLVPAAGTERDSGAAVAARVEAAHPGLEVVLTGCSSGPSWWVGVD